MRRALTIAGATVRVIVGLGLCAVVIALALALRIVYETVMLPVRVWRAERDGPSWPEHLVAEDRELVPFDFAHPPGFFLSDAEVERRGLTVVAHHRV